MSSLLGSLVLTPLHYTSDLGYKSNQESWNIPEVSLIYSMLSSIEDAGKKDKHEQRKNKAVVSLPNTTTHVQFRALTSTIAFPSPDFIQPPAKVIPHQYGETKEENPSCSTYTSLNHPRQAQNIWPLSGKYEQLTWQTYGIDTLFRPCRDLTYWNRNTPPPSACVYKLRWGNSAGIYQLNLDP